MGLQFVVKPPSAVERDRGNALAIDNAPDWLVWFWIHHSLVPAYRLRAKRENECGCNNAGTHQAFFANQLRSRIVSDQETHGEWSGSGAR